MIELRVTVAGRVGPLMASLPGLDPTHDTELVLALEDPATAAAVALRLAAAGVTQVEIVVQGADG